MASPHATGVAALIVSKYGRHDTGEGGLRMNPDRVKQRLLGTAEEHACPMPRLYSYEANGLPPEYNAFCAGDLQKNGFYGRGIVDAYAAVLRNR
jgi:hypothetical protein